MSGYGFTVDSSGNDDEDRGAGFQPAVQNQTHKFFSVASQSVIHDAIIARHAALQFAPAIYFQDSQQTIADYPSRTVAGSPTYTYVNTRYIDEPVSRGGSGGLRYYHRNQQYSITAVSDGGGSVVERYAYSAYGQVTITDGTGSQISNTAISNRYSYTGREWDEGLSLYHFRARMYDALGGRFLARDRLRYLDGSSLYRIYSMMQGGDPIGTFAVTFHQRPAGQMTFAPIPFPKPTDGTCAATDCDESGNSIKTVVYSTSGNPSCNELCKSTVVSSHEAEHRKNMGTCCDRRNACLANAMNQPEGLRARHRGLCQQVWSLWKKENELSLEQRAAAVSCDRAKDLADSFKCDSSDRGLWRPPSPSATPGRDYSLPCNPNKLCCDNMKKEVKNLCENKNASAMIKSCPYGNNGEFDLDVIRRLNQLGR